MSNKNSPGQRFRDAVASEHPLQVVGAINANHALLAKRAGFKAIYLSGGGVAAGSLGVPDLGITGLDDVLTDVRRITDVCDLPLLVDVDTGFGSSFFNVSRTVKSMIKFGAAAIHIEDQVGAKRCGHRPNKEIVSQQEMIDRIKAAVDARTDDSFVIMARTDALAVEGLESALERAAACVEAGADMVFPEAITELEMYKLFAGRVRVPLRLMVTVSVAALAVALSRPANSAAASVTDNFMVEFLCLIIVTNQLCTLVMCGGQHAAISVGETLGYTGRPVGNLFGDSHRTQQGVVFAQALAVSCIPFMPGLSRGPIQPQTPPGINALAQ